MNSRIPSRPRILRQLLLTILVLSPVLCFTLYAQNSQGTVLGHVTDPTGAVVPGASVKLTNTATGIVKTLKTSGVGDYIFVNVIPGNYDVAVEMQGFKTSKAAGVRVEVEATVREDFALQTGGFSESVTVTSDTAGQGITCSATSTGGAANATVTVKR